MKNLYSILRLYIFLLILPTVAFAKNVDSIVHLKHQDFEVSYGESGVSFLPKTGPIEWKWKLSGISGMETPIEGIQPSVEGNDIRYYRGNVTEQYLFKGSSIEQQFIIHSGTQLTQDLVIEGSITSSGQFSKVEGGWSWTDGLATVFLGDVYVYDATSRPIPASMLVSKGSTRIVVAYSSLKSAIYPITIDPQIGPDDFVLANNGTRLFQPRLIYNPTSGDQTFFSSWTNYNSGSARRENIYGESFTLQKIKDGHFSVDEAVTTYEDLEISGAAPAGAAANSSATKSDVAYSNSTYLAVWEDFQGPYYGNQKVKYRLNTKTAATGNALQVFKSAAFAGSFGWAENPAVAGNNQKYLITATTGTTSTNHYVFGKYIANSGLAESLDSVVLMSSAEPFIDTEVDARPSGSFYVAAAEIRKLYFGIAPATGSLSPNSLTTLGNIGTIAMAAGSSQALLVWSEVSSGKFIIKGVRINSSGASTGSILTIDDPNYYGSGFPSVAYNSDSESWLVVWHSSPLAIAGSMIFGREVLNDGTMNNIFPVSKQTRTSVSPTVAYDSQNKEFWIAWSGGGSKDQLLAQRWTSSMIDCIISMKRDTIHENNYLKNAMNPVTDKYVTSFKALTAAGDSIYPLDFIPDVATTLQTSYLQTTNTQTKPNATLNDIHTSRNKLFYVLNDSINYEKLNSYSVNVYAQSETPGASGKSSLQAQTVRVVDMNEKFYASVPTSVSFLEDEANTKIPFTYNSGDNGKERNSIQLSVSATPNPFSAPPILLTNPNPSIPGGGHSDAIPRTQVNVQENLLFSLKQNVSGTQNLIFTLTDLKGGPWSADQKDIVKSYTTSVTVIPVNDVPTFDKGSDVSVNEDAGAQTISAWATNINKGAADESAQTLTFNVSNNNNALFSVQPSINATSGNLTFTPAANLNGTATVTVSLKDDGGVLNGGVDESAAITFTITVNAVNDAPTFTKGVDQTVSEDSGVQTVNGWGTALSKGPANESTQALTFTVTNDNNSIFDIQPDVDETTGNLTYTPKANAYGTAIVSAKLSDDGGTANGGVDNSVQTFTITISPVNDIPLFTKGVDQTVLEDAGAQAVAAWATGISAGNSFESGQTLTFVVSNDNNSLFTAQPAINSSGNLTFTPASNANGTATVSARLEDNGGTANGGVNSTSITTFIINVTSVNDSPQFTAGSNPSVLEDSGVTTIPGWASGISTGPSNESSQTLSFQVSAGNPDLFSVQPSVNASGDLSFTPAANEFGTTSIQVTLADNGGTASGGVDSYVQNGTITITGVNDKPLFTKGANQTVLQGVGAQTVAGWATNISAGAANEAGQVLAFGLTNDNSSLFDVQPAINPTTGTLTYTPKASADGTATISVQLTDNGGTANGGIDASSVASFTISVVPVNSAPSFTTGPDVTVNEDIAGSLVWATNIIAGPSYESGQALTFILNNDNTTLFSIQPAIDATTGILTFTPAVNGHGTANVQVKLKDNGGTANGGVDESSAITFSITVNSSNDAPSFVKGADQTILEDAGAQTVNGWATSISSGPADESSQILSFTVINNNNSLFDVQPDVDETTGILTYTPKANAYGTATVSVTLSDNGGITNGGVDNSVQTFTITISPVNDVPLFTKGADQTVLEDAGAQSVAAWATEMSSGPANESSQTLTFTVTNDNNSLFVVQPDVDEITGTLTYTSKANFYGTATISVKLSDNEGTANGGVDQVVKSFIINVTPVNDAPSFVKGADQSILEDAGLQTIANWATTINPGNPQESSQTLQFSVTNNNNALFSVQPSIDAITGTLTYTPANNAIGTAVVTVGLTDDGGVSNGGVDASAEVTFTIVVTPVNDAPLFTAGSNITVNQNANVQSLIWATNIAAGPANESGETLLFILNNDNTALFSQQPVLNASTGIITFKPASNLNGVANIQVQLKDNGGIANGGVDVSSIVTFSITVNQVNQQPTFVKGADQAILEDSGSKIITGWATAISSGPASESGQILTFTVTNDNLSLFDVQPDVDEITGTLTYTPKANAYGVALVTVTLSDNGGTADGGIDRSTQTFTITISSVNDAPFFTKGNNQTVLEDAGTQTVNFWAKNISKGNVWEESQSLQFIVSNNNTALFSIQPAIDAATGNLTFAPANNVFGSAAVSVVLKDNGGITNGGEDTSSEITFTISVASVNDAPEISTPLSDVQVKEFEDYNFIANKADFADPDGDNLTLQITAVSGNWVQKKNITEVVGFATPDSDDKAVVTVRATDPQGLWVEDKFEINIVRQQRPLVYGQIFGYGSLPKELPVVLFSTNANKPDSIAVTSTINKDYYYFEGLSAGSYIVKVVNSNTKSYPLLASTYFTSTTDWTKATTLEVKANNQYMANIIMAQNKVTEGVGTISGYARVTKGVVEDMGENEPLAFVDITLTGKGDGNLELHTQTSIDGSYQFSKLPLGEYVVTIAVPGFQSNILYTLKIEEGKITFENINFLINLSNEVITDIDVISQFELDLYPNPTPGLVNLRGNNVSKTLYMRVIDMNGQVVLKKQFEPANLVQFDIRDLLPAPYLVEVRHEGKIKTFTVLLMNIK